MLKGSTGFLFFTFSCITIILFIFPIVFHKSVTCYTKTLPKPHYVRHSALSPIYKVHNRRFSINVLSGRGNHSLPSVQCPNLGCLVLPKGNYVFIIGNIVYTVITVCVQHSFPCITICDPTFYSFVNPDNQRCQQEEKLGHSPLKVGYSAGGVSHQECRYFIHRNV